MKIEWRIAGGSPDYIPLADDASSERISGYKPGLRAAPQVDALAVSPDQPFASFVCGRSGDFTLSFAVDRQHASEAAAAEFLSTHLALFSAASQFHLKITVGASVIYLAYAAPTSIDPDEHSDQHTFVRYSFVGSQYTEDEPA